MLGAGQAGARSRSLQHQQDICTNHIQTSFPNQASPVFPAGLGLDGPEDFNPLPAAAALEPPHRTATPPSLPTDTAGEDNSLLASIVLCLWHCTEFREQVGVVAFYIVLVGWRRRCWSVLCSASFALH